METELTPLQFKTTKHARVVYNPDGEGRYYLLKRRDVIEVTKDTFDFWISEMKNKDYKFSESIEINAVKLEE